MVQPSSIRCLMDNFAVAMEPDHVLRWLLREEKVDILIAAPAAAQISLSLRHNHLVVALMADPISVRCHLLKVA